MASLQSVVIVQIVRSAFPLTEWKEEASEMRKLSWIWAALGMNRVPGSVCVFGAGEYG